MGLCLLYNLFRKRDAAADTKQGRGKRAAVNKHVVSYIHLPYVFFCYFPGISHFFLIISLQISAVQTSLPGDGGKFKIKRCIVSFHLRLDQFSFYISVLCFLCLTEDADVLQASAMARCHAAPRLHTWPVSTERQVRQTVQAAAHF